MAMRLGWSWEIAEEVGGRVVFGEGEKGRATEGQKEGRRGRYVFDFPMQKDGPNLTR